LKENVFNSWQKSPTSCWWPLLCSFTSSHKLPLSFCSPPSTPSQIHPSQSDKEHWNFCDWFRLSSQERIRMEHCTCHFFSWWEWSHSSERRFLDLGDLKWVIRIHSTSEKHSEANSASLTCYTYMRSDLHWYSRILEYYWIFILSNVS